MKSMNVKNLVFTAMFAAVLCILGPLALPIGPVPISLGTFGIYLIGMILPWQNALLAVVVYLLLGMAGLPVFTGFSGGLAKLAGPTGGYLVGYLFMVFIISFMVQKLEKPFRYNAHEVQHDTRAGQSPCAMLYHVRSTWYIVAMILGTIVLYAFGSAWFMISMKANLITTLTACVFPFLIGDGVKIAAAFGVGLAWKKRGDL